MLAGMQQHAIDQAAEQIRWLGARRLIRAGEIFADHLSVRATLLEPLIVHPIP
jgi:hypothetical protein